MVRVIFWVDGGRQDYILMIVQLLPVLHITILLTSRSSPPERISTHAKVRIRAGWSDLKPKLNMSCRP